MNCETLMRILFILFLFFYATNVIAQGIQIKGSVTSASGVQLPGVNVIVKGTSKGTATDFDGNYTLDGVSEQGQLLFSYIGFQNYELSVGSKKVINVILTEDSKALKEVVVIGYGTQTKKEITGAVSVISSKTIEDLNPVRIEQALQGQVAGVNISSQSGAPGAASSIQIRGISTNGDSRPLILVDGNVIENLSVLNPNDIKSVNILKDATAGIYGVRAANGVILITTKTGRLNQELKFEFDAFAGFQRTSRKLPLLNATEYGLIINEAQVASGNEALFTDLSSLEEGTDWQDKVFKTAAIGSTNLSVTGGGEKSTYSGGISYLSQDGIVGASKSNFNRLTGRLAYSLNFAKSFKFNTTALLTQTNRDALLENSTASVLFSTVNMAPTIPVRDENGEFSLANGLGIEVINPLAQIESSFDQTEVNKIAATFGLQYSFWSDFSAESRFQYNYSELDRLQFAPVVNYGSSKTLNQTTSRLTENNDLFRDYTWDNFVKYEKLFGDKHDLKVLLAMSTFQTITELAGFTGLDLPGNTLDNANISEARGNVVNLYVNGGDVFRDRLLSYFTRIQYAYDGKYLFSGVLRRDGSTKFGPRNKFGIFPSASVGWVVSEEDFLVDSEFINLLKFRGSYGVIGNDRIPAFGYTSLLNGEAQYVENGVIVNGRAIGRIANPDLVWEKQKTLDIGMDMQFAQDKFNLTIDYFKKTTEDLLDDPLVSGILGVAGPNSFAPIINSGTVQNEGWEFAIGYSNRISENFKFNINYNATFLENEVLAVNGEGTFIDGGSFGVSIDEVPSRMEVGQPIGYFYGRQAIGVFQDAAEIASHGSQPDAVPGDLKYRDINGDNRIDSEDRANLGNPIPEVTMGFNIGMTYKRLDFSTYINASLGNDMVRDYERDESLVNKRNAFLNRWTGAGSTNSFPRAATGDIENKRFSSFYVEDASYARIQNIQVGYTVPEQLLESIGISKLRIYASVNNLFTFTKYSGYDPSAFQPNQDPAEATPIGAGVDKGFYPVPTVVMGGVNIKF